MMQKTNYWMSQSSQEREEILKSPYKTLVETYKNSRNCSITDFSKYQLSSQFF